MLTNGFVVGTMNHFGGDMLWHPMKLEIQDWVDFKELDFAQEESEGSRLNPKEWLERYPYTDIHDIFCEFTSLLHEWFLRLETQ